MKNRVEHRTIKCEFRVDGDTGKPTIYGYAAKYNVRSSDLGGWVEVIAPTAFDNHLKSNPDVRALFNHNQDVVLGRTTAGTLKINSDSTGLAYEVNPPDTQAARDLITSMKRGDINQSSFGFICRNAKWSTDADTGLDMRTVNEAELFDCSPVTYPAYPQATSGVRSLPEDMPMEVRSRLQKRDLVDGDPVEGEDVLGDVVGEDKCQCQCAQCLDGDCADCSNPDCDDPNCSDDNDMEQNSRRMTTTKSVDGENLTADDFLIVGDPSKTDTWHLPWKFSTEEKTVSHLRDALSRFNQVEGVSDEVKKAAWDKLVKLCKEHQIDVSTDDDATRTLKIRVMLASLNSL
jgi:HK97 family phage prohead protease